ncbi:hypothetical protein HNP46_005798 [Pseudomonas nitritireducens]|uniref:Uncharacterized protein n=1 Tax=Pseudomonas nitroreducens TaxID=46680 RepID=A0A7W7KQ97_PSENT|nr:hypothetical protein [Pseudomonas nitritireducens]MBB4866891.1 hypothetical protein [Pseudomonas nitritireducens]
MNALEITGYIVLSLISLAGLARFSVVVGASMVAGKVNFRALARDLVILTSLFAGAVLTLYSTGLPLLSAYTAVLVSMLLVEGGMVFIGWWVFGRREERALQAEMRALGVH